MGQWRYSIAPHILISELVGGEGQLHVTAALPRGNIPGTHRIGGRVCLSFKMFSPANRNPIFKPVTSH
jgi:hypothetical protein